MTLQCKLTSYIWETEAKIKTCVFPSPWLIVLVRRKLVSCLLAALFTVFRVCAGIPVCETYDVVYVTLFYTVLLRHMVVCEYN